MNTKFSFLLSLLMTVLFFACKDDTDVTPNGNGIDYTVQVKYPEAYGNAIASGVQVTLKNLTTNIETIQQTDELGNAVFSKLTPGNYTVAASKSLSATETEALTGIASETYLNATITQLQVLAAGSQTLTLSGGTVGGWVIKEYYYSGAANSYYFYDAFIELYNNSTDTLYADGLLIGTTKSATASATSFYGFISKGLEDAYVSTLLRIPGSGKENAVAPGKSYVIAIDAINHKDDPNGNANSPVNLGKGIADAEVYFYVNPKTPDTDNPDVPNVEILHSYSTTLFDYIPGVMGSGLVIFRDDKPEALEQVTEPNSTSPTLYIRVPKDKVIDALDASANMTITPELKRLPSNLDAGFNSVGDAYTGTSLRRKIKQETNGRKVLVDTNNSTNDFEVNSKPSPKGW